MKLKVYEIKKEYVLRSRDIKQFLRKSINLTDIWWNYKLILAETEQVALQIYKEKYDILKSGDLFDYNHQFLYRGCYKAYVTNVELTVEEVDYSIDTLKEKLTADDFMKYFVARNIEYTELFGK